MQSLSQPRGLTDIQDLLEGVLRRYQANQKQDRVGTDVYCGIMLQGYLLWEWGISLQLIDIFIT